MDNCNHLCEDCNEDCDGAKLACTICGQTERFIRNNPEGIFAECIRCGDKIQLCTILSCNTDTEIDETEYNMYEQKRKESARELHVLFLPKDKEHERFIIEKVVRFMDSVIDADTTTAWVSDGTWYFKNEPEEE